MRKDSASTREAPGAAVELRREPFELRAHRAAQRVLRRLLRLARIHSCYMPTSYGRIHYYDSQPGSSAPPVLFLHGLGVSGATLLPIAGVVAQQRRVVVPDMMYFAGLSEPSLPRLDTDGHIQALAEFLDGLGCRLLDACGHSLGGGAAIHLAARHPELVRSLALINPGGFSFEFTRLRDEILGLDRARAVALYGRIVHDHSPLGWKPLRRLGARMLHALFTSQGVREYIGSVRDQDYVDDLLRRVQCRTMLLWGKQDQFLPVSIVWHLIAEIEHLEAYWLEQCSHLPILEAPHTVYELLAEYWGLGPAPGGRSWRLATRMSRQVSVVPIVPPTGADRAAPSRTGDVGRPGP
jgi:pimeloyl-ACP methyl ester carboxylesterase